MERWRDHWAEMWEKEPVFCIAMGVLLFCIIFVISISIWVVVVIGTRM